MKPIFNEMQTRAKQDLEHYSSKSSICKALNYLLNNYEGLTLALSNVAIPLDNNGQERLLRSPVVGRKTWYGTHSKKGARTAAKLFTIS